MLFNSYAFLIFMIVTFIVYYLPWSFFKKNQIYTLIIASFFFYAYERPLLLLLLVFSVMINSIFSFSVYKVKKQHVKKILLFGVMFNISLLAFFKYSPLIASSLARDLSLNNGVAHFLMTIPLPIGISFYTFEGVSLLMDLYKGKTILNLQTSSFTEHFKKTAFFISFFPHLIAGPILKAREFYPQMETKYFQDIKWSSAFKKIILGFFLKMVIADNLNEVTATMQYPFFLGFSSGNLILLLFGYSMQIFADFAGYSLIAIGLGAILGYNLPDNFNFPYISSSFSEFWRRWHISLSTWLRDYLYIPLGGSRKGELRTYINLFIVMFLGGLWHGAAWSYAVWGSMHGLVLMIERWILKDKIDHDKRSVLGVTYVFVTVTILWLMFKLTNFTYVLAYLKAIVNNISIPFKLGMDQISIVAYGSGVVLYHAFYLLKDTNLYPKIYPKLDAITYGCMLFFIMVNSGSAGAFIYFQF